MENVLLQSGRPALRPLAFIEPIRRKNCLRQLLHFHTRLCRSQLLPRSVTWDEGKTGARVE